MTRQCLEAGCPVLLPDSKRRCPTHQAMVNRVHSIRHRPYSNRTYRRNRLQVLEDAGYICFSCGGMANTVDHILPVSHGGGHERENLRASCLGCNVGRANRARFR